MRVVIEKLTDWDLVKRAALQTRNLANSTKLNPTIVG